MKQRLIAVIAGLSLTGCASMPPVNLCKYASVRRAVYTTTIRAADAYALSGRPVPYEVSLGRQAAVTALGVLDTNCPAVAATNPG